MHYSGAVEGRGPVATGPGSRHDRQAEQGEVALRGVHYSLHAEDLLSNTTHLHDHVRRLAAARATGALPLERFWVDRERLRRTTYSSRGRLSRGLLALYANADPRDWALPDRSVLTEVYYELTDHPNLHHIFPRDFCANNLGQSGRHADSLLNIAYLTQITNLRISNRNPLEYVRDYLGAGFAEIQRTHLLPDTLAEWARSDAMPEDALDMFIESRLDLVLARLCELLGDVQMDVIDTRAQPDAV